MKKISTRGHILNAFIYSWKGFKALLKQEIAFRQDLMVFIIGTITSFCFSLSKI